MDLVATASKKDTVDIWRYNGQRVFGLVAEDGDTRQVRGLAWRADGKMLAVSLAGGTILLLDSFSGKVAHQLRTTTTSDARAPGRSSRRLEASVDTTHERSSVMSWQSHFANAAQTRQQLSEVESTVQLDDLLGLNPDVKKLLKSKANLPRELARVEVDVALPKLSTLPATGADDDVFSTRQSIDTIFHAQNTDLTQTRSDGDIVDVLLTTVGDCMLHISIFDSFAVGSVDVSQALPKGLKAVQIENETSHPFLSKHFLAVAAVSDGLETGQERVHSHSLHLLSLDLRFISQISYILPLVVTKATQLQNLLRYIVQVSDQLSAEVRTAFDLPSRFVENINETLAEEDESVTFMTEAYHLIVTGMCGDKFREWLVDQVGERGLKRWEKAVGDCLDMMRRMTSECLMPAVERAQIVLSRLDGLARFVDTASKLGLDEKDIRDVREAFDALTIHCEDMLRDACTEIREFAAFMRWIKWEAEVQMLGEDSERADEMRETYNGEAEVRVVLDYIDSAMKKSRLVKYISADSKAPPSEAILQDTDLLATYKKARSTDKIEELPKLSDLVQVARRRSDGVFHSIAETLRKNVLIDYVTELPKVTLMDSKVIADPGSGQFWLHVVGEEQEKSCQVTHVAINVDTGSRGTGGKPTLSTMQLPEDYSGKLWDVKIADGDGILALVADGRGQNRALLWRLLSGDNTAWETQHVFADGSMGSGMVAGQLLPISQQRRGRRGVVVSSDEAMGFVVLHEDSSP